MAPDRLLNAGLLPLHGPVLVDLQADQHVFRSRRYGGGA
jgi:hypothetical protein